MRESKSLGAFANRRTKMVFLWSTLGLLFVASVAYVLMRGPVDSGHSTAALENLAHARLQRLSEKERAEAMTRVLAPEGCDVVVRSFHQGTRYDDGTAFWNFACRNGRSFMVSMRADENGSTDIADCAVMKVLGVPCFEELDNIRRR
jgi:hypothetical protein